MEIDDTDREKYDKIIPKWAKKATIQFIPQLASLPSIKVNITLPDDKLYEVLKYQQSYKGNKAPAGAGCLVLNELIYDVPNARSVRQVLIDMSMFLFVEIFYYESS